MSYELVSTQLWETEGESIHVVELKCNVETDVTIHREHLYENDDKQPVEPNDAPESDMDSGSENSPRRQR